MSSVEDEDLLSSITKILQLCNSEQENAQKARAAEAKKRADEEDREKRRKDGFSVAAAANRGAQAYKEGDYARAIDILSDALEFPCADTLKASILSNRAHAHFKLHNPKDRYDDGHLASALSDCDRVAELASTPHYKTILLAGMILVSQADYDAAVSKGKKALACSSGREEEEKAMDFLNSAMAARINSRRSSDGPRRPPEPTPDEARILKMLEEMSLKTPHEVRCRFLVQTTACP
ncbi:hypothetical protein DL93DRAFT_660526 [Clavulina sp. PMI_390]|nr:hypothetical protein DL93DRAFT_660526 [Clavulina sp. PMI_390]